MAPTQPKSGLFVGINKGHVVTKRELPPRPSDRKGVSFFGPRSPLRLLAILLFCVDLVSYTRLFGGTICGCSLLASLASLR